MVITVLAVEPGEPLRGVAAAKVGLELPGNEPRERQVVPGELRYQKGHALAQDLAQLRVGVSSKFHDAGHRRR